MQLRRLSLSDAAWKKLLWDRNTEGNKAFCITNFESWIRHLVTFGIFLSSKRSSTSKTSWTPYLQNIRCGITNCEVIGNSNRWGFTFWFPWSEILSYPMMDCSLPFGQCPQWARSWTRSPSSLLKKLGEYLASDWSQCLRVTYFESTEPSRMKCS